MQKETTRPETKSHDTPECKIRSAMKDFKLGISKAADELTAMQEAIQAAKKDIREHHLSFRKAIKGNAQTKPFWMRNWQRARPITKSTTKGE